MSRVGKVEGFGRRGRGLGVPLRESSLGQKISGVFLVVISCLIVTLGGLVLLFGVFFWIQIILDDLMWSTGIQWVICPILVLGGLSAMFVGNVAAQVGAWIAGKDVWSGSQHPVRAACRKAFLDLVSVFGIVVCCGGALWLSFLFLYGDFSTMWLAICVFAFGLGLLSGVVWWRKRAARRPN